MAKQKKETFNDMLRQLQATKVTASQPVDVFEERRYFLIVCEGKRTEPIYFEYFKKLLPKNLLETIEIKGKGDNTINIVKAAIKERDDRKNNALLPAFDEVWAVFDKDDFPPKNFNRAIELALQQEVECGHSNESFELWYVLHFQFLNTALKRQAYIEILTNALGFKYQKNSRKVVEYLFNKKAAVGNAINWAKQLEAMHAGKTHSDSCPYTRVYLLVKRLLAYTKKHV